MPRSLGQRLFLLRDLMSLKCGPGAAILPPNVTRIHMDFAKFIKGGHMGPRKFWREYLPRLKYHNPLVPMIVNRHMTPTQAPLMTIYFRNTANSSATPSEPLQFTSTTQPSSSRDGISKAQPPTPEERVVTIDMKDIHSEKILEAFLAETKAQVLSPDALDLKEMQELEKLRRTSEKDTKRQLRVKAERAEEQKRLDDAVALGKAAEEAA